MLFAKGIFLESGILHHSYASVDLLRHVSLKCKCNLRNISSHPESKGALSCNVHSFSIASKPPYLVHKNASKVTRCHCSVIGIIEPASLWHFRVARAL